MAFAFSFHIRSILWFAVAVGSVLYFTFQWKLLRLVQSSDATPTPTASTRSKSVRTKTTSSISAVNDMPYARLQDCIDEYTSRGSWGNTSKWDARTDSCQFQDWPQDDLPTIFRPFRVGFMGDSTTRSDLRTFEEIFQCERTDLDEMSRFQLRDEEGKYICKLYEQSMNLTKCGIPPVVDVSCRNVAWRYFYKVYPMTPLDEWYFERPELFADLDALVINLGRWLPHYRPYESLDVEAQFDAFLTKLKAVFSGIILYQSEYPEHDKMKKNILPEHRVTCAHAKCMDCGNGDEYECAREVTINRPQSDLQIRKVSERHQVPYLDRWNISKSLPMEYFQLWYCHDGGTNQWFCDHHLHFVGLQHLRLVYNVILQLLPPS